jgi:hypothetical protein
LKIFVEQWEEIFGLRYMSSNIHSLLHIHQSVAFMVHYTFTVGSNSKVSLSFEDEARLSFFLRGIGHDSMDRTHGMTHYGQHLFTNLQYYRQAIMEVARTAYPLKLLTLVEQVLTWKATTDSSTYVKKESLPNCYAEELEHLNLVFNQEFLFFTIN